MNKLASLGLAVLSPFSALTCPCTSRFPPLHHGDSSVFFKIVLTILTLRASAAFPGVTFGSSADRSRSVGHLCDSIPQKVKLIIALHHSFEMLSRDALAAGCAGNVGGPKGDADHEKFEGFGCTKSQSREEIQGAQDDSQTTTGVTWATLPTSSSAWTMRLILATGNFVLTTTPSSSPGACLGALDVATGCMSRCSCLK